MRHTRSALIAAGLLAASLTGTAKADTTYSRDDAGNWYVSETETPLRTIAAGEVLAVREDAYSPVTTMLVLTNGTELIVPSQQLAATGPLAPGDRVLAVYENRDGAKVVTWLDTEVPDQYESR
jgi:hypothetical protein